MPGIPACVCTAMRLASDFQWVTASWAGRLGRNRLKQVVSESEFFSAVPWPEFWDTHTFLLFSFLSRNKPTEKYSHAIQVCYRTSSFGQQPSICFLPIQKRNRQMFQGLLEIMGEEGMQIESEGWTVWSSGDFFTADAHFYTLPKKHCFKVERCTPPMPSSRPPLPITQRGRLVLTTYHTYICTHSWNPSVKRTWISLLG